MANRLLRLRLIAMTILKKSIILTLKETHTTTNPFFVLVVAAETPVSASSNWSMAIPSALLTSFIRVPRHLRVRIDLFDFICVVQAA